MSVVQSAVAVTLSLWLPADQSAVAMTVFVSGSGLVGAG